MAEEEKEPKPAPAGPGAQDHPKKKEHRPKDEPKEPPPQRREGTVSDPDYPGG